MTKLKEYNFEGVYEITNLIDTCVNAEEELWNYNVDFFIDAATKFSNESLLHLYIVTTSLNYYRTEFRKNGSDFEDYYF